MVFSSSAASQTACGKRADIVKRLQTGYGEVELWAGIATNGDLVELFVAEHSGWSILFTQPGGKTCLMAVGKDWQIIENPFAVETGVP